MNIITLTKDNLTTEHICCALASKTSNEGINAKKGWLNARIDEGLRFKKLDARGKVFIEYIPCQNGWMPIQANNYMLINCFWVSGSFKGKGYGKALLEECEKEAKELNMDGIVVVVGNKKKPFLSDKEFLIRQGFEVVDSTPPFFELLAKQYNKEAIVPQFAPSAKEGMPKNIKGVDIFYTPQCPFSTPYVNLLKPVILASDIPVRINEIQSKEEAQSHFCPVTTYSIFVNGEFYTNEILTPNKFEKLLAKI